MPARELNVSFGYQCNTSCCSGLGDTADDNESTERHSMRRSSSFSCLSGAALSANATLANTSICSGIIGEEILPSIDSPKSFKRMSSSPSLSKMDQSGLSTGDGPPLWKCQSAPSGSDSSSFLHAMDVQTAGGAAGEDRVQAVCSEDNEWLFCGVYDGFNGRDAADYLAGTLYERIALSLQNLERRAKELREHFEADADMFSHGVIGCLIDALAQAEYCFLRMVREEMEDRPELVSVGSCVLVALLHVSHIYVLNLGDSRAILATEDTVGSGEVRTIQLTEIHTLDNESECKKVVEDHPDDPSAVRNGRVKGKLKVTRAFGVGCLKESEMNDMLMGILRIQNLCSPPYVYSTPFSMSHRMSENDRYIVLGSDGLFDFFTNDEAVQLVHGFIQTHPVGDPAKHLVEQLVQRAARTAGFSVEELLSIPAGRRRKYHDDVTVIVIILGSRQQTSTASTAL
ncbi:hypothetical protein MLD38_004266 [Melastoma candidum]|uniref:Uncharacterized protein n=1 Tax=Melastoma candidum TaxID=119954 RepID=A0ACB9S4N2_9MYRT|nr:hypothetical protein MLD38_004266 [Melastoma candidum]